MSDEEYDTESETMYSEESEEELEEHSEDEEDLVEEDEDLSEEDEEVSTEENSEDEDLSEEDEDLSEEDEEVSTEDESEEDLEEQSRLKELKSRIEQRLKRVEGKETMYDLLNRHFSNVDKNRFFFGKSIHKIVNRLFEMECLPLYHSADEDLQDICLEYDDYGVELCKSMESSSFAEEHMKMVREKIERINVMYDDIFSDLMELQPIFNDLL